MVRALVTGGAGFIGSHIVDGMVKRGIETRVLDNFSTGKRENLAGVEDVQIIEGDIRDLDLVHEAVTGVDLVFHQGALASVADSFNDPAYANSVNIAGTLNVLLASRDAGVQKVIFAGSSSAYGDSEIMPKEETMRENPISPYAVTKMAGEKYFSVFAKAYGLDTVVLRYFNVFGPRQDPSSPYSGVISLFITKLLAGERPAIFGDGEQTRDFVFVENVVMANIFASVSRVGGGDVFNVAAGEKVSVNELFRTLQEMTGTESITPIYREARKGDIRHSVADTSKARQALGFWPVVGFKEGLEKTVDWYRRQGC